MKNLKGKRYWLIGASDGIGYELAKKMDNLGASLIISARDTQRLNALSEKLLIPTQVVYCDVTDSESIRSAYDTIGPIDGVVYMAGEYTPMHSQNWVDQDVIRMADTNFLGALRVLGACMPSFVSRDNGHIVIVGSLAGFTGLQGAIGYGASKAALMHLSENISSDLYKMNIKVQLFNPGFVETRLTEKNSFHMPFKMSAEKAAGIIARGMLTKRRVINFPWFFSLVFRFGKFLPNKFMIFGKK